LLSGFEPSESSTLLVEIGGGKGHDLVAFDVAFGKSKGGELVLQNLPQVLNEIPGNQMSSKIQKMVHDFFGDQPVKGKHDT
jgi:hypothetical protein